ncbi:MAG: AraC family transcriptional regulator, partial [Spirochaetota bacterium]
LCRRGGKGVASRAGVRARQRLLRQREGERSLVELHERGEALLPFVEEALLEGLMLGDHRHDRREAALALLGIGETLALAVALAFAPEPGLPDPEKEVESLHARLRETLRYRSRALVGPIFSRTSLVLLPCRDAQDAQRRVVEFRLGVEKALGPELIRGTVRLGLGAARPWALAGESWSEALAALGGAEARPSPGPWSESGDRADFSEDEDFLRLLIDGDESRAALSLGRILDAACGADSEGGSSSKAGPDFGGRVPAAAAGRVVALFGTAYRLLARRGLLAPHETQALLDLRELATEAQAGPWRLAAEARFSRLHEVLTRQVRHSPAVNKALAHIAANYPRPIGLESTAELVGLSPSRLSRLLVEETGRGFSELLIDRRIERAKELLADSGTSIKEVSLASGYADPNYFARLFKKVTGLPPTAWAAGRMEDNDA